MRTSLSIFKTSLVILLFLASFFPAEAKKWVIKVQNYTFSPFNLTHVKAGDTIRWSWVNGVHSTTSTDIPVGANPWDFPITQDDSVFQMRAIVAGTYNYISTPDSAQGMSGTFTVTGNLGISGGSIDPDIIFYPNPARDIVTFSSQGVPVRSVKIYDLRGNLAGDYEFPVQQVFQTVDLGSMPEGVYLFAITTSGNKTVVRRVVHLAH